MAEIHSKVGRASFFLSFVPPSPLLPLRRELNPVKVAPVEEHEQRSKLGLLELLDRRPEEREDHLGVEHREPSIGGAADLEEEVVISALQVRQGDLDAKPCPLVEPELESAAEQVGSMIRLERVDQEAALDQIGRGAQAPGELELSLGVVVRDLVETVERKCLDLTVR